MHRKLDRVQRKLTQSDIFETEYFEVPVDEKVVRYVDSNHISRERVNTLFDKEPTTIPWLESFKKDEVFVDIGANVGMYSVYAGAISGARVFSFEPESQNYADLNQNIFINGLHRRVSAFCVAMSDADKVDYLYLSRFGPSYSHHDFGQSSWDKEKRFGEIVVSNEERLPQGCVSFRLDTLVDSGFIPAPNHIKIDVDGFEGKVIEGAWKTLQHPGLKSVLLEVDYKIPTSLDAVDRMLAAGWKFSKDQVRMNRHEILPFETVQERMKTKLGGQNFIFYKDDFYTDFFERFISDFVPPHPPHQPIRDVLPREPLVPRMLRRLTSRHS